VAVQFRWSTGQGLARPVLLRGGSSEQALGGREASREGLRLRKRLLLGEVRLGDGVTFTALLDTGSGNLVVPSVNCASLGCQGHRRFHPEDDETGRFISQDSSEVSLSYASARLTGNGFEGRVCLGGACGHAGFVVAAWESDVFKNLEFDAILGLGPPGQAASGNFNVLRALAQQAALPVAAFVLSMRSQGNSSVVFGSLGALGGSTANGNASAVATDTGAALGSSPGVWLPVDVRHGEWAVPLADVSLDDSRLGMCGSAGCRAVLDSGCPGITLPAPAFGQLGAQLVPEDCSPGAISALPSLRLVLADSHVHEVMPQQYVEVSEKDPSKCRPLVFPAEDFSNRTVILGVPFLLDRDVVFDQERMRIGVLEGPSAARKERAARDGQLRARQAAAHKSLASFTALGHYLEAR